MLPPYGWTQREEPTRTLFVGFDVGIALPFVALYVGGAFLGFPTLLESVVVWGALVAGSVPLALLRGFRLEVSAHGFTMWKTWCGVPYWRVRLPLTSRVETSGGFGEPDDRVIIERELHAEDVSLGSASTCAALCEAIQRAQHRWTGRT